MALLTECTMHMHTSTALQRQPTCGSGCLRNAEPRAVWADSRRRQPRLHLTAATAQSGFGEFGAGLKKLAKQVQGALPIVGLLSRLASTGGGIGSDEMSYPDYCRMSYNVAPEEFNIAFADWSDAFGREGQRRYILLCLWMAVTGAGLVPARNIILSMRRLRVTFRVYPTHLKVFEALESLCARSQDIEVEMDRFEGTRDATLQKYTYMERPKGSLQERVDIAVDALCTLCIGIKDDVVPSARDQGLLVIMASAAVSNELGQPAAEEMVKLSIAARPQRAQTYAALN